MLTLVFDLLSSLAVDPVTPDAERMSRAFPGSVVLTQQSAGVSCFHIVNRKTG